MSPRVRASGVGLWLRQATAEDIPAMHRIRVAVRENALSSPDRITPADYQKALDEGCGWVAGPEDATDAMAGFAFMQRDGNVWALFVDPDREGQGYGSALHARLLAWAEVHATKPIWLSTGPGTRAERFYRAHGWQDGGLTPSGERRFERARV